MTVEVLRPSSASEFLERAAPLLEDRSRHQVVLGICSTLQSQPDVYAEARLWLVEEDGEATAAALFTPPYEVAVVKPSTASGLRALVETVAGDVPDAPGAFGALPEVQDFATVWTEVTGGATKVQLSERLYEVTTVNDVPRPPGEWRWADESDHAFVLGWLDEFRREALPHRKPDPPDFVARMLSRRLRRDPGGIALWEDGEPVCFVGHGAISMGMARIGPVYTPPRFRRRGCATALTAEVTRSVLNEGAEKCLLYTDLSNPTSNKIYMDIGYKPICDSAEISFRT